MAAGWAEADLVLEHKYKVPHVQHVPRNSRLRCPAERQRKDHAVVIGQSPFLSANLIAKALHINHSRLRHHPHVGGGSAPRPA